MRLLIVSVALATLSVAASASGAQAHTAYYTTYRPETRYVAKTVIVRERVWRPVRHRIHYRRLHYSPYYDGYTTVYPVYREDDWGWREHERREHEHWRDRGW